MNTNISTELDFRAKRDEARLARLDNLGIRLANHFGSDFLHQYKRTRFTSVDTNRVQRFMRWLDANDQNLFGISLNDYADTELADNAVSSKISAIGTIRGCIKRFVRSQEALEFIADMVDLWEQKDDESQALTVAQSIQKSILNRVTKDRYVVDQTKRDNTHAILSGVRLSHQQMKDLILVQWTDHSLRGLQNAAIVALLGGFGLRSEEALNVHVEDFSHGHLFVRKGKGAKERSIPYSDQNHYYRVVQKWIDFAGIKSGRILRSINRWGSIGNDLSYRGLNYILKADSFDVNMDGEIIKPNPHDYRRSASRIWFDAGISIYAIAQNLGHTNADGQLNIELTTQYIGLTGSEDRMLMLA